MRQIKSHTKSIHILLFKISSAELKAFCEIITDDVSLQSFNKVSAQTTSAHNIYRINVS